MKRKHLSDRCRKLKRVIELIFWVEVAVLVSLISSQFGIVQKIFSLKSWYLWVIVLLPFVFRDGRDWQSDAVISLMMFSVFQVVMLCFVLVLQFFGFN